MRSRSECSTSQEARESEEAAIKTRERGRCVENNNQRGRDAVAKAIRSYREGVVKWMEET